MRTTVQKVILPEQRRILVISDIHGNRRCLEGLLQKIHFCRDDILFLLGDYIEKGPESLATLQTVMDLCSGENVYALCGNMEAGRMELFDKEGSEGCVELFDYMEERKKHWGGSLFSEMIQRLGLSCSTPTELPSAKNAIKKAFAKELDFMRSLPTIIETQAFIFVHAALPTENLTALEGADASPCLRTNAFMAQGNRFHKYVIAGHWPVTLYHSNISSSNPIINQQQRIVSIDGGCSIKPDGQLNVLMIPSVASSQFSYESYSDLPVKIAANVQPPSQDSINITWIDNFLHVLRQEEEFSYVEHLSTKRRLWIPTCYLLHIGGTTRCQDSTDYQLPVCPGDSLSIVLQTSRGCLAKKDGVTGWYFGGFQSDKSAL